MPNERNRTPTGLLSTLGTPRYLLSRKTDKTRHRNRTAPTNPRGISVTDIRHVGCNRSRHDKNKKGRSDEYHAHTPIRDHAHVRNHSRRQPRIAFASVQKIRFACRRRPLIHCTQQSRFRCWVCELERLAGSMIYGWHWHVATGCLTVPSLRLTVYADSLDEAFATLRGGL